MGAARRQIGDRAGARPGFAARHNHNHNHNHDDYDDSRADHYDDCSSDDRSVSCGHLTLHRPGTLQSRCARP